ncbi:MAG: D-aminoacylase [Ignavibacteriales bacterium]|nr:D-aminoacylase [Ignavibacteriales bacterium]
MRRATHALDVLLALLLFSCQRGDVILDVVITGGKIVDGTGNPWFFGDVGIQGEKIVAMGKLKGMTAKRTIDATGKIIAPGFIDMLGQSGRGLLIDNRAMSKISQGITTEVTGEGGSVAPVNDGILNEWKPFLDKYNIKVDWNDFEGYFKRLEENKTAINLGSFVGATQVRAYVVGYDDRDPTPEELEQMRQLVRTAMRQGALGVSSSLIYAPAIYAKTQELMELAKAAAELGGMYISHIRDEGDRGKQAEALFEAADIARTANCPVEIWHLKVAGKQNWGTMNRVVNLIRDQRERGIDMAANVYPYTASSNALDESIPGWVHDGGTARFLERLADKALRKKIRDELRQSNNRTGVDFEGIMIAQVNNAELKPFEGKRLSEVARTWKKDPYEAMFDFILLDQSRTSRIKFSMHEEDLRLAMGQPWTSFCTDAGNRAADGPLAEGKPHPRAYGSFTRILGHYVRDVKLLSLEEAIRKMTSLPANRVGLKDRGVLRPGTYADVVVFDPDTVADKATFENPHQYSVGVEFVFVNGKVVWENGTFTGNLPGKVIRGPGYKK